MIVEFQHHLRWNVVHVQMIDNQSQEHFTTMECWRTLSNLILCLSRKFFHVEWYKLIEVGEEKTILLHDNGFHMINTSRFEATSKPSLFPSQCDQNFLIPNLEQPGWSFVIDYDPRGRRVTFIQDVEDNDLLEDAEVPPKYIYGEDGDDENFIINDAYDQNEYHDEFTKFSEGNEQPNGHQVHEDDEFIHFNLPVVEGDEDYENDCINLFVDLWSINDGGI